MYSRTHSKFYPHVSPQAIWNIWTDINQWSTWHSDLDYCTLKDEFKVGNHFTLKPKGAPAVKVMLTEINEGQSFTDSTHFIGAKMFNTHTIEPKDGGVLLSNKLVVTGLLKWIWIKLVAQHVADTVSDEIDALVHLAQSNDVTA